MAPEDATHDRALWAAAERLYYDGPNTLRGVRFENLSDATRADFYRLAASVIRAYEAAAR